MLVLLYVLLQSLKYRFCEILSFFSNAFTSKKLLSISRTLPGEQNTQIARLKKTFSLVPKFTVCVNFYTRVMRVHFARKSAILRAFYGRVRGAIVVASHWWLVLYILSVILVVRCSMMNNPNQKASVTNVLMC